MAKDKKKKSTKKKRKGIVDPRIQERKVQATSAEQERIESDIRKYSEEKVDRPRRVAAVEGLKKEEKPEVERDVTPVDLTKLSDVEEGATATSGFVSASGKKKAQEAIKTKGETAAEFSQVDPTEAAAAAELIAKERASEKEPEPTDEELARRHQERVESGQFDEVKAKLDAQRAAREAEEAAKRAQGQIVGAGDIESQVGVDITSTGTDLKSGEPTFEEVVPTPGQEKARSQRSPRRGTGIFDPGSQPRGAGQTGKGRRSQKKAEEKIKRVAATPAEDPIHVLSQNIRKEELEDQGLMAKESDLSPLALHLSNAQTKAIIMHHTGVTHSQLKSYMGGEGPNAEDKLQSLHDNIMGFVRSTHKYDQAAAMGLVRGEDGKLVKAGKGFATTPTADTQYWQHPTETDEKGMPKVYKVSEMHPDMVKELNHPWGGYRSENPVEGIKSVTFKDPKTKEESTQDVGVSQHFGHHQHENTGTWRFMKPPANFDDKNGISANSEAVLNATGILSNAAAHISRVVAGVPERFKKSRGKDKADELVEAMGGKRRVANQPVAVPMPGFKAPAQYEPRTKGSYTGLEQAKIEKEGDPLSEQQWQTTYAEEGPRSLTIQDLPQGLDEHGNPVALPPRAGIGGTGRSVLVRRGPSMRDAFRGPAAASADTLKTLTTPESFESADVSPTPIEKQGDVFVGGTSPEEQQKDALAQASERLSGILRSNRERAAVGQQFRGAPQRIPQQTMFEGMENYGGKDTVEVSERPLQPGESVDTAPEIAHWPQSRKDDLKARHAQAEKFDALLLADKEAGVNIDTKHGPSTGAYLRSANFGKRMIPVTTIKPSGKPDELVLRSRAEAEANRGREGGAGGAKAFATTEYDPEKVTQPTLDFNPRSDSPLPYSKQFLGGTVRPLTEAESNIENIGANTERGMNPPASMFDVGANTPTAAPSTVAPPLPARGEEPVKKSKAKGKVGSPLERVVNGMVVNIRSGKPKRVLRSSPIEAGVRASEIERTPSGVSRDLAARLDQRRGAQRDADKQE